MTTGFQDQKFLKDVIGTSLLDYAIAWIASELEPLDVFTKSDLEEWAEENGFEKKEAE